MVLAGTASTLLERKQYAEHDWLQRWPPVSAGAALAQKVSYDFDKTANFAGFKTYAHKEGTKVGQELIDDRIVAAHGGGAGRQGLHRVDQPRSVRGLSRRIRQAKDISTYSSGYGGGYGAYGWGWGGGWERRFDHDASARHSDRDARDRSGRRQEGQLAWRGMGVKEVDTQAKPEKRDKSINNAVKEIFKNYPPKQKT